MSIIVPLHKWRSADPAILIGRRCIARTDQDVVIDGRLELIRRPDGTAMGMALAGGHWLLSLLFLLLTVLFAINGWRAVGRARMRKTECREFVVDGCHNLIIAGDD
jgi:hypothetical protein